MHIKTHTIRTLILIYGLLVASISCSNHSESKNKIIISDFKPGEVWLDTDSIPINAHGGGILFYDDLYYWFGEHKTSGRKGNTALVGISCYSSPDLYNWENRGIALSVEDDTSSEITKGCVMERPKVLFNKHTGKFVMWFHLEYKNNGYKTARTAVAQSDNPTGPYKYIRSFRPDSGYWPVHHTDEIKNIHFPEFDEWWTPEWNQAVNKGLYVQRDFSTGQMSRDMTLFLDDDGKAYHIHASEENLTLHISELTPDFLSFTGKWTRAFPAGHNEAPALFKYNNKYYMITSGCTGWEPNAARSAVAESIMGPWESLGNPCLGKYSELTFNSQSTYVLNIQGKESGYIFMADRWNPSNPIDGRYVWLPIQFINEKPVIQWYDKWDINTLQ